jgi:DNA-binding NarL/FixJ family response regulator
VTRPRLLIVDDHQIVIEGLVRLLGERFEIVETLTDGRGVVEDVCRLKPDLMLIDLSIPPLNGLEIISQLKARHALVKTIVLTMHAEASLAVESLRLGASAFVLKQSSGKELLAALQVALDGGTYLASQITKDAVLFMMGSADPKRVVLSERQQEVLRLLVRGQRAKEVGAALGVSARAVEATKYRIMRLLQVHSTAELVRYTIEHQVVSS